MAEAGAGSAEGVEEERQATEGEGGGGEQPPDGAAAGGAPLLCVWDGHGYGWGRGGEICFACLSVRLREVGRASPAVSVVSKSVRNQRCLPPTVRGVQPLCEGISLRSCSQ